MLNTHNLKRNKNILSYEYYEVLGIINSKALMHLCKLILYLIYAYHNEYFKLLHIYNI